MVAILAAVALFLGERPAWGGAAETEAKAREAWMSGYVKLEEATKAEEGNNQAIALDLYRHALTAFSQVRIKYPAWNQSLLDYRISFCNERIKRLEASLTASNVKLSKEDLVALTKSQDSKIKELNQHLVELKKKLEVVNEALDRARNEAARGAAAEAEAARLTQESRGLKDELQAAAARERKLTEEVTDLRTLTGVKKKAEELQQALDVATTRQADADQALESHRAALGSLKEQLKDASAERERLAAERQALQAAATERERVAAEKDRLLAAEQKAAAALRGRIDQAELQHNQFQEQLAKATEQAKATAAEVAALRPFREQALKSQTQVEDLRGKLLAADQERAALMAARDGALTRVTDLQKQLAAAAEETKALGAARDAAVAGRAAPQPMTAAAGSVQDLQKKLAASETERQALVAARDAVTAQVADLQKQLQKQARIPELDKTPVGPAAAPVDALDREKALLVKTMRGMEERARAAETRLVALDTEVRILRTALADKTTVAQTAQAAALTADLQRTTTELADARKRATAADEQMAKLRARVEDLTRKADTGLAIEAELQKKEAALEKQRQEAGTLSSRLAERDRELAALRTRSSALTDELNRANRTLETLQTTAQQRAKELEQMRRGGTPEKGAAAALQEKVAALEQRLQATERERQDARKQQGEVALLLKRHEQTVASQEKELAAARQALAAAEKRLETATAPTPAPPAAVPAETAGTEDSTKQLAAARELHRQLTAERNQAQKRAESLELRFQEVSKQAESARQELQAERVRKAPASEPLLEELRKLNRALDQERAKATALEQTITQLDVHAPAETQPLDLKEQKQRDLDKELMVRNFLQQAGEAEKQNKVEAATWNYRKVLDFQPDNKTALKRLGLLAAQQSNEDDAERFLRKAFYTDPDDVDVLHALGFALVRQGKADLAVSMLARAVALHPDEPTVHRAFGVACSSLGWTDAAEVQFRRAVELNAKDSEAAFNLAVLLAARKPPRTDEAKIWYRKARDLGMAADPGLEKLLNR